MGGYFRWARDHDACHGCGTTALRHKARGLCVPCYGREYRSYNLPGTWIVVERDQYLEEQRLEDAAVAAWSEYCGIPTEEWIAWRREVPWSWTEEDEAEWVWWHESAQMGIPVWGWR